MMRKVMAAKKALRIVGSEKENLHNILGDNLSNVKTQKISFLLYFRFFRTGQAKKMVGA